MGVVFIETAVLGNLRATSEDHAGVDLENDIRRAWVVAGIVEFVTERLEGEDFLNAERLLIGWGAELGDYARR